MSETKWISVNERLPQNTEVLALFDGWDGMIFMRVLEYEDGEWFDHNGEDYSNEVTHWMPLPPPPTSK